MNATAGIDRKHRYRKGAMGTVGIVGASLTVDVLALSLYAAIGKLSPAMVMAYAAFGAFFCATLFRLIDSGRAAALGDPAATRFQFPAIVVTHLLGLVIAPQIGIFFILSLFLIFSFAALTMTVKQAVAALFSICAMVAVCLLGFDLQPMIPAESFGERVVTSIVFSLTLTRMVLVATHSSRQRELLRDKNRKLADSLERVEKLAITDTLTGVFNRGWMVNAIAQEIDHQRAHGGSLTLAMLDIDHFKQVNDRFGHLVGDQVLRVFAEVVRAELRPSDQVARVGGEEFLVLLRATPYSNALPVLERIRQRVSQHPWHSVQEGLSVTVSIGAACQPGGEGRDALWGRADAALYAAKSAGRNCIRANLPGEAAQACT